jgi:hypothetical protein
MYIKLKNFLYFCDYMKHYTNYNIYENFSGYNSF